MPVQVTVLVPVLQWYYPVVPVLVPVSCDCDTKLIIQFDEPRETRVTRLTTTAAATSTVVVVLYYCTATRSGTGIS
jgi:hypothetical protein